jgi:hypothetical protein
MVNSSRKRRKISDTMIQVNGDIFYEITDRAVKDILPKTYYIDEDGRVFSTLSGRFMHPSVSDTGYYAFHFKTTTGKSRGALLHRILMLTFNYNDYNPEYNFVNHMDGDKLNNDLSNYEWTNNVGNLEHAQENNLLQCGENCDWSILTENDVKEICEHFTKNDYGTLANLAKKYNVAVTTIGDIARRITWKNVSDNYDFNYDVRKHFTDEQVHFMCKVFETHKNQSFNYCYFYIIFNLAMQDCRNIRTRIYKIYKKDKMSFPYITSQYNY